jgi:hypothetical protein
MPLSGDYDVDRMLESGDRDYFSGISRYHGINPTAFWSHNTMEFRIFNSSLNYERMCAYIEICAKFMGKVIRVSKKSEYIPIEKQALPLGTLKNASKETQDREMAEFKADLQLENIDLLERSSTWQTV